VKSRISAAFAGIKTEIGYSSIHPMFGPMEDFSGRAVCVVPLRENPRAQRLTALIESWGAQIKALTAQQHDAATAMVQALPHAALIAFGATLAHSEVSFDLMWSVATPVQKLMLALVARVVSGEHETYWSIQTANPYAAQAREALALQLKSLSQAVAERDSDGFTTILDALRSYLTASEAELTKLAAECVAVAKD